jgi:hypothetical protein
MLQGCQKSTSSVVSPHSEVTKQRIQITLNNYVENNDHSSHGMDSFLMT